MTRVRPALRGLIVAGLSVFSLPACKVDADFSDVAPKPVILNADEYRKEITGLDRLIFGEGTFREARRAALAKKLGELAERVRASSDSPFIALEALEIRRLAEAVKSVPDGASPTSFQNEWMRIRNNLFDDRSWFARSAADLEAIREEQKRLNGRRAE